MDWEVDNVEINDNKRLVISDDGVIPGYLKDNKVYIYYGDSEHVNLLCISSIIHKE